MHNSSHACAMCLNNAAMLCLIQERWPGYTSIKCSKTFAVVTVSILIHQHTAQCISSTAASVTSSQQGSLFRPYFLNPRRVGSIDADNIVDKDVSCRHRHIEYVLILSEVIQRSEFIILTGYTSISTQKSNQRSNTHLSHVLACPLLLGDDPCNTGHVMDDTISGAQKGLMVVYRSCYHVKDEKPY